MNHFLKSNLQLLGLLGLVLLVVLVAYIFRPKFSEYNTSVNETIRLMKDHSQLASINDIAGKQLIDLRPANLFVQGHPANAINIPLRQLLDKENIALFKKLLNSGQEAIIYGTDELQATAPWLLLQQLGYKNVKLMRGGYTPSNEFKETAAVSKEESCFDKTAFRVKSELTISPGKKVEQLNKEMIIPVRKAGATGGGC